MKKNSIYRFISIVYLIILIYWMFFGFGRKTQSGYHYNVIPFLTIYQFINVSNTRIYRFLINILGNIGVFIPFGLLMPKCFTFKYKKLLILFIIGIFILELLQLISRKGSFDIDDIILNTIGFNIGYILYKILGNIRYGQNCT